MDDAASTCGEECAPSRMKDALRDSFEPSTFTSLASRCAELPSKTEPRICNHRRVEKAGKLQKARREGKRALKQEKNKHHFILDPETF